MSRKINIKPTTNARKSLLQAFPATYIKHGLNGTKAYMELKPNASNATARSTSPAIVALPSIQERIRALLPSEKVEASVIRQALTGKIEREINWTERHKYLETSLKLKGLLNTTNQQGNTNIGIIIER